MDSRIKKRIGSNMDIDFSNADFGNTRCPWNESDNTNDHKCAVKNTSICIYFYGIQFADYGKLCYIVSMDLEIVFVPSSFKHGVTEADIRHAYQTKIYTGSLEGYDNKYAFIGFNRAGNPIEVFFNPIGDDTIKVFHAMGCRKGVIAELRQSGGNNELY
jgi:hypothetical protein